MRHLTLFFFACCLALCSPDMNQGLAAHAAPFQAIASVDQGPDISETYLEEARQYREQGRYELARQSYVQALSTCRNSAVLEVIQRELAGVELLLRTMR